MLHLLILSQVLLYTAKTLCESSLATCVCNFGNFSSNIAVLVSSIPGFDTETAPLTKFVLEKLMVSHEAQNFTALYTTSVFITVDSTRTYSVKCKQWSVYL